MKKNKMQCKDVSDVKILQRLKDMPPNNRASAFSVDDDDNPFGLYSIRPAFPEDVTQNLVRAKMAKLIDRGLVDGCACGCRGDFEITDKGIKFLQKIEEVKP